MKILLLFFVFFADHDAVASEPKVGILRNLFYASENNKAAWIKLEETVKLINHESKPILLCYRGVSEMMGAKYVINPIVKFNRFKKGKSFIERAIQKDPDNPEIRFLRFSIQTNLPTFLGYHHDIVTDKKRLLDSVDAVTDLELKKNIVKYLSSSKYCTAEEKKILVK
jgi:hypothetical protein